MKIKITVIQIVIQIICTSFLLAQTQVITGKVVDENGEGIPGVNILAKGTVIGTITDAEGKFKITIDKNSTTIIANFVGYSSVEVEIGDRSEMNIVLNSSDSKSIYWCCTNHPSPAGPHCDQDKEELKKAHGCKTFKRSF